MVGFFWKVIYVERLLTPQEAADMLRVSVYTLLEHARKGCIPATKVGREWRFVESELASYLEANRARDPYAASGSGISLARDAVAVEREVGDRSGTAQDRFIKQMIAERRKAWDEYEVFKRTLIPVNVQKLLEESDRDRDERYERWLRGKREE